MTNLEEKINFQPFLNCLADKAFLCESSRGRRTSAIEADEDQIYFGVMNPYFIDKNKILLSKSYRRMDDKTQVFLDRKNVHTRNRLIHTSSAITIGVMIARITGLNEALVESILLLHDNGHTPYGHLGERAVSRIANRKFQHATMSVVIAQKVERSGRGLNISYETLEGALQHPRNYNDLTVFSHQPLEYGVAALADKLAYVLDDLNDAICCAYFKLSDIPSEFFSFGKNQRERTKNIIYALVSESYEMKTLSFCQSEMAKKFQLVREWSFENFYRKLDSEFQQVVAWKKIDDAYGLIASESPLFGQDPLLPIALMGDSEINRINVWLKKHHQNEKFKFQSLSYHEILKSFPEGHKVDMFNADLNPSNFSKPVF